MAVVRKANSTNQVNHLPSWLSPVSVERSSTASVLLISTLCVPISALNTLYSTGSAALHSAACLAPPARLRRSHAHTSRATA
jgi:hypothetical protein